MCSVYIYRYTHTPFVDFQKAVISPARTKPSPVNWSGWRRRSWTKVLLLVVLAWRRLKSLRVEGMG